MVALRPPKEPCEQESGWYVLSVPENTSPAELLSMFGIESFTPVCVRNGNVSEYDALLNEGDEILFMHAVYGG